MARIGIVGGGNLGANIAFFAAERGIADVLIYDNKDGLAKGKSLDMMEAAPVRQFRTYIEAWPRGRLRLEAELNLVDALVRLGRDAESLEVVERLVRDPQARARRAELRSLGVRLKVNVGDCAGARTWILDDDPRLLAAVQRCETSDE